MPDITVKSIDSLSELSSVVSGDKLVVQHNGAAYQADASLFKGADGAQGADGQPGTNGVDGVSPTVSLSKVGKVTTITVSDATGTKTANINDGNDGVDGTVAFEDLTPAQIAQLKGDPGVGMPAGGTEGQIPAKASSTDYDFVWVNPADGNLPTPTSLADGTLCVAVNGAWTTMDAVTWFNAYIAPTVFDYDSSTNELDIVTE